MKKLLYQLNTKSKEAGYEVHCVSSPGKYVEEIKKDGFIYHEINVDRKIHLFNNIKTTVNLVKLFKKERPEIVHVHTPIAGVLGRIAAKIAGVPNIIYTAHGFYFHDEMSKSTYKIFYYIEKIIGNYFTDYIFTQSREDFEIAKKGNFLSKKNKNNYVHISNGVDIKYLFNIDNYNSNVKTKLRQKYNVKENEIVVSFLGRLVKEKGVFDLLNATNFVQSDNVKFLIIGGVRKDERDQESTEGIKKFLNNDKIIFAGHRDDIPEHLLISDIFCLPSYREGMPRSIIEAMAMKNAILATNIRGSREEVIHGETGFLFTTHSSESIAQYIDILVNDRELLENMKINSYNRAKSFFDEDDVINKQLSIFNNIKMLKNKVYDKT
ncbi:glycosyltransferase family 4 protein [Macrococcus equi]|uniref:glycosyltransferase family 4 protein n=1 Tax=Macrococcus equi TaxID=3395462 RepID=UPI0039BE5435